MGDGDEDDLVEADEPCEKGGDGPAGVVCIGDGGPEFGVGAVMLEGVDMVEIGSSKSATATS